MYIEGRAAGCSGFDLRLQLAQSVLHLEDDQLLFSGSCGWVLMLMLMLSDGNLSLLLHALA